MGNHNDIIRNYVCAVCWGSLHTIRGEIVCRVYGKEHAGFVTRKYAEKRRAESYAERANAMWNIGKYFFESRTEEELIRMITGGEDDQGTN